MNWSLLAAGVISIAIGLLLTGSARRALPPPEEFEEADPAAARAPQSPSPPSARTQGPGFSRQRGDQGGVGGEQTVPTGRAGRTSPRLHRHEQILLLAGEGLGPAEIARRLGMGRGEVELILRLWEGTGGEGGRED